MWLITRKPHQPVVVARRSLSSFSLNTILALFIGLFSSMAAAQEGPFIAQLHAHTPEELQALLNRAEAWSNSTKTYPDHPISVILHGSEASAFVKANYQKYQSLVDQAAKLDAFNVVDIKICERWMGANMVNRNQLPAFVETVPYGIEEERKLIKAGFQSF